MSAKPNIFAYRDYREYLMAVYNHLKEVKPQFSFRYFSRQAGFRSPNYLKLVMDGERNLSHSSVQKFCDGLKLSGEEREFFENLVYYTQAKTFKDKQRYYERMATSKSYLSLHKLEKDSYDYFSKWYHVATYEMLSMKGFRPTPTFVACNLKPNITLREAQQALDRLVELGLLERKGDKLVKARGNLSTGNEVHSLAAANFQKAMAGKAAESIDITHAALRDISSLTVAIPKDRIEDVKKTMQNFRRQLHALLQDDKDADAVYQINFQMFPLTVVRKENK